MATELVLKTSELNSLGGSIPSASAGLHPIHQRWSKCHYCGVDLLNARHVRRYVVGFDKGLVYYRETPEGEIKSAVKVSG